MAQSPTNGETVFPIKAIVALNRDYDIGLHISGNGVLRSGKFRCSMQIRHNAGGDIATGL